MGNVIMPEDLVAELPLERGDRVLVASDVTTLCWEALQQGKKFDLDRLIDLLQKKIGPEGTLLFPTYNWDFCHGKAFDYRKNISLQHFQDLRIGQVYRSLLFDPYKLSITLFLAEFLIYATRDETDNRQLYDFIETSLLWLDNADGGFANFHLVFMLRISLFIGFYPNLDDYHEGCWFDLREGCFTPLRPSHNDCLKPDEAARMRTIMRMSLDNMHLFRMSRVERNRCAEIILYYYRLHQSDFPELRSIEVLKELF